jgi:hypothetical protein
MAVENIVVKSSKWKEEDLEMLFDDEEVHFTEETTIPRLMKELNIFPSTSQAIRAGRTGDISEGFTDRFKASKKRTLWIWNPTE